jgi:hypothetical protein
MSFTNDNPNHQCSFSNGRVQECTPRPWQEALEDNKQESNGRGAKIMRGLFYWQIE